LGDAVLLFLSGAEDRIFYLKRNKMQDFDQIFPRVLSSDPRGGVGQYFQRSATTGYR